MNPPSEFKVETVGSLYGNSNRKQKKIKDNKAESKSSEVSEFGLITISVFSFLGTQNKLY